MYFPLTVCRICDFFEESRDVNYQHKLFHSFGRHWEFPGERIGETSARLSFAFPRKGTAFSDLNDKKNDEKVVMTHEERKIYIDTFLPFGG
jgi:hypothetical protein